MLLEGRKTYIRRASDAILRGALEEAFMTIGQAADHGASEELSRVEHAIVAGLRDLAPPADLIDATMEAAIHAVALIREAIDNAHQRLGSATLPDSSRRSKAA